MDPLNYLARRTIPTLLILSFSLAGLQLAAAEPDSFGIPERLSYYLQRTYGWQRMAWLSLDAGFDCAMGGDPGVEELFRAYGDGFGRRIVRNSFEFGLGTVLREDARYKPLGQGGFTRRLRYATARAFQASVPGSRVRPAYSRFAALTAGELIPSIWSAHGLSPSHALSGIGFGVLGQMQNNYLTEFSPELKRFGRNFGRKLRRLRQ